jgi:hypothetical protein
LSILVLALLVGIAGGAVLTTIAAARRTSSAFDRMVRATDASAALVNPDNGDGSKLTMSELRSLPGVKTAHRGDAAMLLPASIRSAADLQETPPPLMIRLGPDPYVTDRPLLDAGRFPDPSRPDELFVERWYARQQHLHIGSHLAFKAVTGAESAQLQNVDPHGPGAADLLSHVGTPVRFRVVGIGGGPESVAFDQGYEPIALTGTEAFWKKFTVGGVPPSAGFWGAKVQLAKGVTADDLRRELQRLHPDESFAVQSLSSTRTQVDRAVAPQVVALWIFAGIAAFIGLFVVGQAIARRLAADGVDNSTLGAMGMTRRERFTSSMMRLAVAALAGAGVAVLLAYLLSPIGPVGPARLAEPTPGFAADGWVLLAGGLSVALLTCLIGLWPAWRTARVFSASEEPRPSRLSARLAEAGAPVAAATGVRFALEPGSRSRPIPARSTIVTAATAVAVVVAVVTFAASIDHLVGTPRLYGFPGTFVIQNVGDGSSDTVGLAKLLDRDPQVKRWSTVRVSELDVNGRTIPTVAFAPGKRPLDPVVREGRAPRSDHEIALGSSTMHTLGVRLGDTVRVGSKAVPARVVGTVVMPAVGTYEGADKAGLGEGVLVTPHAMDSYAPSFSSGDSIAIETSPSVTSRSFEQTATRYGAPSDGSFGVTPVPAPADITALRRLRSTPVVLAALLVLLIMSTVVHALVLAMRRRRHDVAVLQCMGMRPGQVLRSSLWQAATIAVIAAGVGIPLGLVVGRWSWVVLAGVLGVVQEPTVPSASVAGIGAAVLVVALLAGLVPGWRSSRRLPAFALRAE